MTDNFSATNHVFLTGVTGFLGKVVLESLLRQAEQFGLSKVSVLVRPKKSAGGEVSPSDRFAREVLDTPIFEHLPAALRARIEVEGGDLELENCGLAPERLSALSNRITHVIHCAASVEFDLPIADAARANIRSALNVLEVARLCPRLVGMTDVSTAYVTVWRPGSIHETLAHLPRPAEELYQAILDGSRTEKALKEETGHPNTYTYTKCLAEHLLCQRRGTVPLSIVRPSIISAAWQTPIPGWIDSTAAYAGCLLFSGMGAVRIWAADPTVRLDVVPVDVVAARVLEAAFRHRFPAPGETVPIHYAVMGIEKAMPIGLSVSATTRFFRERPAAFALPSMRVGRVGRDFEALDFVGRELRTQLLRGVLTLGLRPRDRRRLEKVDTKVRYMNAIFGYFTHHTFDFRPSQAADVPGYDPERYADVVLRGIYRHLLRRDETQVALAGRKHKDARRDLAWLKEKGQGAGSTRALAIALRKAMRRCTEQVTFDRPSFERAAQAAPADALFVLAPSHRSYFDFLLMSYLCFQHPELGIPMPFIAAAEEFAKIPLVGRILEQSRAFYIRRGLGKKDPALGTQLERIAESEGSVMFFVEGQRSRSRHVLAPKRGLLRGLQETGRRFAILPIAFSYDRMPEEAAFARELGGGARSRMSLTAILKWLARLARGEEQLGRIHIACGAPVLLDRNASVPEVAQRIVAEQQAHTTISSFHLRAFLAELRWPDVDEAWLRRAVEQRGGRVLESALALPEVLSPALRHSLQNQWRHWFYGDATALFPKSWVVLDHVSRHGWAPKAPSDLTDPRIPKLVEALFRPVAADYALAAREVGDLGRGPPIAPKQIARAHAGAHLPHLEDAYRALVERHILIETDGVFTWGPNAAERTTFLQGCALELETTPRKRARNTLRPVELDSVQAR